MTEKQRKTGVSSTTVAVSSLALEKAKADVRRVAEDDVDAKLAGHLRTLTDGRMYVVKFGELCEHVDEMEPGITYLHKHLYVFLRDVEEAEIGELGDENIDMPPEDIVRHEGMRFLRHEYTEGHDFITLWERLPD